MPKSMFRLSDEIDPHLPHCRPGRTRVDDRAGHLSASCTKESRRAERAAGSGSHRRRWPTIAGRQTLETLAIAKVPDPDKSE